MKEIDFVGHQGMDGLMILKYISNDMASEDGLDSGG
jgi:hypothetical protein